MNKNIFELCKRNRDLEYKLFNEQSKKQAGQYAVLSEQEILGVIQQIFHKTVKASTTSESPLAQFEIISTIYQTLSQDRDYHIPGDIKISMRLTELCFQSLSGMIEEQEEIVRLNQLLALSWAQLSVHSPEFLQVQQHPAKLVLGKLLMLSDCWDKRGGQLAKKLLDGIKLVLIQLNQKGAQPRLFEQAANRISSLENAFNQYRRKRIQSIVEQKRKEERELKADAFVSRFIQEQTFNEELPVFLLEFVENYLTPLLKKLFMETGPVGQKWHQATEDIKSLFWSIKAPFNNTFTEKYQQEVPQALKRLFEQLNLIFPDSNGVSDFFYELESVHLTKLNGERLDQYSIVSSMITDEFEHRESNTKPVDHSHHLDKILNDDDWYIIIQNGKRFRCQLVPRQYTGKWLVFINLSGACVVDFDITSPSFNPEQLPIIPVESHNYWDEMSNHIEKIMERRVSLIEEQINRIDKEVAADKARKAALEEEAKAILRQRIQEESDRQIKLKQEQERARSAAIEKAKREEAVYAKKRLEAQKLVDNIMPGALVEYHKNDEKVLLTLSIISTTTNKYIFVDQRGQRALDPKEPQLIDLFASGKMVLLEQGKEFETTLQSLVASQRNAMNQSD